MLPYNFIYVLLFQTPRINCELCGASLRCDYLERHKRGSSCKTITCSVCNISIPYLEKSRHSASHNPIHTNSPSQPSALPQIILPPYQPDENFQDIYTQFKKYIEPSIKFGPHTSTYNFQMLDLSTETIASHARQVLNSQQTACKVSLSFGYILKNNETNELAFYWSSRNNQLLFDTPKVINSTYDIDTFIESIKNVDLKAHVVFPNSKFSFIKTTNVTLYLTHLVGVPIGTGKILPNFLMKNRGLVALIKPKRGGTPYEDNLCFFRCLALHNGASITNIETPSKELMRLYCNNFGINAQDFQGITFADLELASCHFQIGINIYELNENRESKLIFRSIKRENVMNLNLYNDHFSFIKDLNVYASSFVCTKCTKIFSKNWMMKRHMKTCNAKTRQVYYSGVYNPSDTIFDILRRHNIIIPPEMRYHDYRICFDIECFMSRDDTIENTQRVTYSFKHELASISVCSNVPDYTEPICFISEGCPRTLVKEVLTYMQEIAEVAAMLQHEKFADFMSQIELIDDVKIQERFDQYLNEIIVLSYNGSRYDLRIIKEQLIVNLLESQEIRYVIKRGSAYSCIATEHFKFLDITSYLAAGVSYDGFLKAYNITQAKSFFPYEYFDGLEKLQSTEFPQYEDFFSSLKGKNTLEPSQYDHLTTVERDVIGREPSEEQPLTNQQTRGIGQFRYNQLLDQWNENEWTFRDFLTHYNNQ